MGRLSLERSDYQFRGYYLMFFQCIIKRVLCFEKNVLQLQHGFERQKIQMLILDSERFFF